MRILFIKITAWGVSHVSKQITQMKKVRNWLYFHAFSKLGMSLGSFQNSWYRNKCRIALQVWKTNTFSPEITALKWKSVFQPCGFSAMIAILKFGPGGVKVYNTVLLKWHNTADSFHCVSHIRPQYYFYSSSHVFDQGQLTGSAHHDGEVETALLKVAVGKYCGKKQKTNRWPGSRKYRPPISSSPFVWWWNYSFQGPFRYSQGRGRVWFID